MPVTTRRQRKLAAASLTSLPVETLEQIFDLAYEETPLTGPICKRLLPFHRARIASLRLPRGASLAHLKKLFPFLLRLQNLHLVKRDNIPAVLDLLPRPSSLRKLILEECQFKAEEETHIEAEQALSAALENLTSLETFALVSDYDAISSAFRTNFPSLPTSLSTLPLSHLKLGQDVQVDASELLTLLSALSSSLTHLTLNFFDGKEGRAGHRCHRWDEFLGSWRLPHWRDGFNYEDLLEVFSLAEKNGVKVDGSVRRAAGVEGEFKVEKSVFWDERNASRGHRHYDDYGGYGGYGSDDGEASDW
ncbi:hypothetical protein JCM11641_005924 [Rhodosporidiobolus odoratus]